MDNQSLCELAGDRVTDRRPTTCPQHPGPRLAEGSFSSQVRFEFGLRSQGGAGASIPSDRQLRSSKGYPRQSKRGEGCLDKTLGRNEFSNDNGYPSRFEGSLNRLDNQSSEIHWLESSESQVDNRFSFNSIRGITAGYESQLRRSANMYSLPSGYYPKCTDHDG